MVAMAASPRTTSLGVATPDATIADAIATNQNGVCTIPQWSKGNCTTNSEDGGMMARIVVAPSPN